MAGETGTSTDSSVHPATLCVVGAGTMGGQIAHQAALHGMTVVLTSRSEDRLRSARDDARTVLERRVEKGKLDLETCIATLERVTTTTDLPAATESADLIIESVAEDREIKRRVLRAISQHAPVHAIIGSNSSTLPSSLFADAVQQPERLLNIHFYNPAMVMPLVEVVRGPHTSDQVLHSALDFAHGIGKIAISVEKETFGFVANRLLFIAIVEAMRLVEAGYVSIQDCDLAVKQALGWPMGPFALSDLVGLDVVHAILSEGELQTGDARWAPPLLLSDLVSRGHLGRKSGRGFSDYTR